MSTGIGLQTLLLGGFSCTDISAFARLSWCAFWFAASAFACCIWMSGFRFRHLDFDQMPAKMMMHLRTCVRLGKIWAFISRRVGRGILGESRLLALLICDFEKFQKAGRLCLPTTCWERGGQGHQLGLGHVTLCVLIWKNISAFCTT